MNKHDPRKRSDCDQLRLLGGPAFRAHVEHCPACRRHVAELRRLDAALRREARSVRPAAATTLADRIIATGPRRARRPAFAWWGGAVLVAAALIVAVWIWSSSKADPADGQPATIVERDPPPAPAVGDELASTSSDAVPPPANGPRPLPAIDPAEAQQLLRWLSVPSLPEGDDALAVADFDGEWQRLRDDGRALAAFLAECVSVAR